MNRANSWTESDHDFLRENYGKLSYAEIADKLGRSVLSVKSRAGLLGICKPRQTEQEKQGLASFITANYATMTAQEIAADRGVKVSTVYRVAREQGLKKAVPMPKHFRDFIKGQHAAGLNDSEIARAWNAVEDRKTERRYVTEVRKLLGLEVIGYNERSVERTKAATAKQLDEAGLSSLAELRSERHRQFAKERGWPDLMPARCVQILDAIYEYGPQTRYELADRIGMRQKGSKKTLVGTVPGGSYLAYLQRLGLVVRMNKAVNGGPKGDRVSLYGIPPTIKRGEPSTWPPNLLTLKETLSDLKTYRAKYPKPSRTKRNSGPQ